MTTADSDLTPILTPCPACRAERIRRSSPGITVVTDGSYSIISCRWCDGIGGLDQDHLIKYCAANGIKL